jgi:hypothetical protein
VAAVDVGNQLFGSDTQDGLSQRTQDRVEHFYLGTEWNFCLLPDITILTGIAHFVKG